MCLRPFSPIMDGWRANALTLPKMELVPDTRAFATYSPTSTPILDVLRPAPRPALGKLTTGEYFFASSILILAVLSLSQIREVLGYQRLNPVGLVISLALLTSGSLLCSALVHEVGHLVASRWVKFRLVQLHIGGDWQDPCHSDSRMHACGTVHLGSMTLAPRNPDNLRYRLMGLALSGPAANLLFASLMLACPYWSEKGMVVSFQAYVVAIFSALYGIAALMPDINRKGNYSDGARVLMLMKNDDMAMRWLAILQLEMQLAQGVHPRDWDKAALVQATVSNDDSRDAVTGNWLAYLWAFESQDITSATRYLEDALAAPSSSSGWMKNRLYVEAAVFQAWFRDNAAKARSWSAMIESDRLLPSQQQRLAIVLLWAEGKLFDAWELMSGYIALLEQIPDANARELARKSALEWRHQMESRMLTRAWRTMYAMSQEVERSTPADAVSS
jgi:hypothetical protein